MAQCGIFLILKVQVTNILKQFPFILTDQKNVTFENKKQAVNCK